MEKAQAKAAETISTATSDVLDKSQEVFTKAATSSKEMVEGVFELNAAVVKGGEVIVKKLFDNYVANVSTGFANAKSMAKATDVADFYKMASEKASSATETFVSQTKDVYDLGQKVLNETTDTAKKIYSTTFSAA
ncbi:MAG: phasin family protein [Pseudomonadota bacterium]